MFNNSHLKQFAPLPVVQKIGVIGAGVMGTQIAALFAGAGTKVILLDLAQKSAEGILRLRSLRPPALYLNSDLERIQPGSIERNFEELSRCDWIIETVVEQLNVKRDILARIDSLSHCDATFSSNTSGLSLALLTEGRSRNFKGRFLITHFFNPVRYMKLVEIVAGAGTDPAILKSVRTFAEEALGKGVVLAKDTPAFIANRIGVFHALDVMHMTAGEGWPIEAVDAVLGTSIGRPKTGIFKTADLVGIDSMAFVAENLVKGACHDESVDTFRIPQFLHQLIVKGHIGKKAGRGFYYKDEKSGKVYALDLRNLSYRPPVVFDTESMRDAASLPNPADKLRKIVWAKDQAGEIAWPAISKLLVYAANRIPEISEDILSVDNAMRWGYGWPLGPFEMWNALGIREIVAKLESSGREVPRLVRTLLSDGKKSFYESGGTIVGIKHRVPRIKIEGNNSSSLIDLGDGVLCLEFHSKKNVINEDVALLLNRTLDKLEEEGEGLVIASGGEHFSVGADLKLILRLVSEKRWNELDGLVKKNQALNQRIRFFKKPVVAAPAGLTLGGGLEICLACSKMVAFIETYAGLVETAVGLIPAGGGCKNLILRFGENSPTLCKGRLGGVENDLPPLTPPYKGGEGPQPKVGRAFEIIAKAKVSGSAREAVESRFLRVHDTIIMDRDRLILEAKRAVLESARDYVPPVCEREIELPGRGGEMALVNAVRSYVLKGEATDYNAFIAGKLAHVLAGGDVPVVHRTTEDHILDLEREAFLSLAGEPKTQARLGHMLETGTPLRN